MLTNACLVVCHATDMSRASDHAPTVTGDVCFEVQTLPLRVPLNR